MPMAAATWASTATIAAMALGTVGFLVVGVVLLLLGHRGVSIAVCGCGGGIGLIGITFFRLRDRRLVRRQVDELEH